MKDILLCVGHADVTLTTCYEYILLYIFKDNLHSFAETQGRYSGAPIPGFIKIEDFFDI